MIKPILKYPQDKEILKQISEEIKDINDLENYRELIQDLKDTMHAAPNAHGISAIQIGIPKRICICLWGGEEIVMINPIITRTRGEQEYEEGCLSAPGVQKRIKRAQKVWCSYVDEDWCSAEIAEGGRMSDIIQHELDHFDGVCKVYEEE